MGGRWPSAPRRSPARGPALPASELQEGRQPGERRPLVRTPVRSRPRVWLQQRRQHLSTRSVMAVSWPGASWRWQRGADRALRALYVFQEFRGKRVGFVCGLGCDSELEKGRAETRSFSAFFFWSLNSCDFFRPSALFIACNKP